MAAVTPLWYVKALAALAAAGVNWTSDTIKVALLNSSYTPNQDTHDYFDDVSAYEVSGAGYTAGGVTLSGKSVTTDAATNKVMFNAATPSWTGLTATFRHLVIYKSTGVAGTSPLLAYITLGSDRVLAGDNYQLTVGADGLLKITAA